MNKNLNPAEQIIQRFGGQSSLAVILGRRQSTVQHWARTGRIPSQWHEILLKTARNKGIPLEPKDFVTQQTLSIEPPEGKLGVLIIGLGSVSSTFIAGVEHVRRGMGKPFGSVTQMATIRLGKRTQKESPLIKEFVPLANLDQLVFGAWDPIPDNAYEAALKCGVLDRNKDIEPIADFLKSIKPISAVFEKDYVKSIKTTNIKKAINKLELVEKVREDIQAFKAQNKCDRLVMIWSGSAEKLVELSSVHQNLKNFTRGLENNDKEIAPSMIYAYAALLEGIPFINSTPALTVDFQALENLAVEKNIPICGKDLKTGQTLVKTVIAPMLKARMLGLNSWFSTNILENVDREVLDEPENVRIKEKSKPGALEYILQPDLYPDLYSDTLNKIHINSHPPHGEYEEDLDDIDIFGWLGKRMQIKINFLCSDPILAAPLVLDLVLFIDLAKRAGLGGIQEWLSFYFKNPQHASSVYPEHDLFIQQTKLKNTLRWIMGFEQITHLGMEYYRDEQFSVSTYQ